MRLFAFIVPCVLVLLLCGGCDEMISEILQGDAELDRAAKSGDPQNCLKLDISKDESRAKDCLRDMAGYEKDETICEQIETGYYKSACIEKAAIAKSDPKLCESTGPSKNNCLKAIAVKLGDRSYCNDVADKDLSNACLKEVALAQRNSQWCRDIPDAYTRRTCIYDYAVEYASIEYALPYCDETETMRDSCIAKIALREGSAKSCQKTDGNGLYDCVYGVAEDKGDAAVCETIASAGTRDKCVHNLAASTHDLKVCENIKDAALKTRCSKSTGLNNVQR